MKGFAFVVLVLSSLFSSAEVPGPISGNPLHWAARNNDLGAAKVALAKDPALLNSVDSDNRTAVHYAAAAGSLNVLRLLIDRNADLDVQSREGVTPLLWAMEFADKDGFRMLLKAGANPSLGRHDNPWMTFDALSAALFNGSEDYAQILIEAGANVNASNEKKWTPLQRAAFSKASPGMIRTLIAHGADVNARNLEGNSSLSSSFLMGQPDAALVLLQSGADITITSFDNGKWHDNSQMNSAGWAAYGGDPECMRVALAYGSDPRLRDGENRDALQVAREHKHSEMEAFLSAVLLQIGRGWNSRHFAVEYGLRDALTHPGPSLDSATQDGTTPLMLASMRGDVLTAQLLLKLGADTKMKNNVGDTAAMIARRHGYPELERFLTRVQR